VFEYNREFAISFICPNEGVAAWHGLAALRAQSPPHLFGHRNEIANSHITNIHTTAHQSIGRNASWKESGRFSGESESRLSASKNDPQQRNHRYSVEG
jgi:hypothetical protein